MFSIAGPVIVFGCSSAALYESSVLVDEIKNVGADIIRPQNTLIINKRADNIRPYVYMLSKSGISSDVSVFKGLFSIYSHTA